MTERKHLWVVRSLVLASLGACGVAGVIATEPSIAHAFPEARYWHMAASGAARPGGNRAGAEGNYFTGGAQDHGLTCAVCHTGSAGLIGATVTAVPAFGASTDGDYRITPGTHYTITVTMTGEHLHSPMMPYNDHNGMTATVEDDNGARAGVFSGDNGSSGASCPANPPASLNGTTAVYGDCHGVVFQGQPAGNHWTFGWDAPAAVSGHLHLWLGVVDGDTGGDSSLTDDVFQHHYILSRN